jgi:hypothetical protein
MSDRPGAARGQTGLALLGVLVVLVFVTASSTSFVWFMNRQQARVGTSLRARQALHLAEAGLHVALAALESPGSPSEGTGRRWRPTNHLERVPGTSDGRIRLSVRDRDGGALAVISQGEAAGTVRALEAEVHLASPALLAGLYGAGVVRLEQPPAAVVVTPYGAGTGARPWIHIAAGREVWFATAGTSINDPTVPIEVEPGPIDPVTGAGVPPAAQTEAVRLLLARGADLILDRNRRRVEVHQLRTMGVGVEGVVLRAHDLPPAPQVGRAFYRQRAAANTANAALNAAAGRHLAYGALERKRDSLYTPDEFEQLQAYLATHDGRLRLLGVVYVTGGISVLEGQRLEVAEGAIVAEGTVHLSDGARLEIVHTPSSRTLPGLLALDDGGLQVSRGARLRVHGLVYASRTIDITDAGRVEVVGALVGNDPSVSFRNRGSMVVVRYDPAVLGTPGLVVGDDRPIIAWVARVREIPAVTAPLAGP